MIKKCISYLLFCVSPFFVYAQESQSKIIHQNNKSHCFEKSKDNLPLKKIHKNVKYYFADNDVCKIKNFDCGHCDKDFRYLPLTAKNNIYIVLVPMDCGDFPYRLYLLTIKDNQIRSKLYVEGEWYEPGNNKDLIEKTHFTISKDFIITITTEYDNNITTKDYYLSQNGDIKERH